MRAPCKGCKDRRQGCHSVCEAYLAFRAQQLKVYEIKRQLGEQISVHRDMVEKRKREQHRKNRR